MTTISTLGRGELSHTRPTTFKRFWFGCCYYPEHWDVGTCTADAGRMQQVGMNVVRMAEFAWDRMEPEEGRYDFSLFDEVIARLGEHTISTILCTPTATPPRWLTAKYPDILRVNEELVPLQHGSRQHCCHASPRFGQSSRRITRAMADHFADNPHVVGWQTGNEFNCGFSECHCDSCQQAFREFLQQKYGDIDTLNHAWGTAFWAQTYNSFEEILTPRSKKPTWMNPSQRLDYYRYLSHAVTMFQHHQVQILRQANPEWFIFHNGIFAHIDYRGLFSQDLDMLGYDVYPQSCRDSTQRPSFQSFNLDRMRSWTGNFIIPEHQSGPGGQAAYFLDNPEPGEVRRMTYTSVARGADSLLYFRWRTCRFGAEEYWCGVLDHDNVPRRRYEEIAQIGKELAIVGQEILGTYVRTDVAVATADLDNRDAHCIMPFGLPDPNTVAEVVHRKCYEQGFAVGCVHPSDDLSGLRLYIIPHWLIIDPVWVPNLKSFVATGGTLVIGARTGTKDVNNHVIDTTPPGLLRDLCGMTVEEYGRQNDSRHRPLHILTDSGKIMTELWYEVLQPETAEIISTWKDRHLTGKAAITRNRVGQGHVYYVGTYFTEAVIDALLPVFVQTSQLQPLWPDAPQGVSVVVRQNDKKSIWFFINTTDREITLNTTPKGGDLVTGNATGEAVKLKANEVLVIKQE